MTSKNFRKYLTSLQIFSKFFLKQADLLKRGHFWEDMTQTRKSIHKEKGLFYNQRGDLL